MATQSLQIIQEWSTDYGLWARECVRFKGKNGAIFNHDHPHHGQIKLRIPQDPTVTRVALKARQVGATSEIAAQFVHQAIFNPGTSIQVLAQTMDGIRGISSVYAHIVEHLPYILRSGVFTPVVTLHRIFFPRLNSEICFATANTTSIRGTPRQGVHITEGAFIPNLSETLRAMRPTCHGPLVIESTANGPGTFYELWHDPHTEHIFLAWTDDATCVSDVVPSDLTPQESKYLKLHPDLTPGQVNWFIQTLRQGTWDDFRQEHPSTPDEAFILSGDRFFAKSFFPPDTSTIKAFQVHAKPQHGRRYTIGVDCASGSKGGDRSTAVILDVTDPHNITTAASFADRIAPKDFGKAVAAMAKQYIDAVVNVEKNAGWGLAVLDALKDAGARVWRTRSYDKSKNTWISSYGWNTTKDTRHLMLSKLQDVVNNGFYVPRDARIESEFNAFRFNEDGRPEAVQGAHDDLVFAVALALMAQDQTRDTTLSDPLVKQPGPDASFKDQFDFEARTGMLMDESGSNYEED